MVIGMNEKLLIETANRVSDANSVVLWNLINVFDDSKHDINDLYAVALKMLEELEEEE